MKIIILFLVTFIINFFVIFLFRVVSYLQRIAEALEDFVYYAKDNENESEVSNG